MLMTNKCTQLHPINSDSTLQSNELGHSTLHSLPQSLLVARNILCAHFKRLKFYRKFLQKHLLTDNLADVKDQTPGYVFHYTMGICFPLQLK